jgi:hypothetical protein
MNVEGRICNHLKSLERGTHGNPLLQRSYDKYGAFEWDLLLVCPEELRFFYEQRALDILRPPLNLNLRASGWCGTPEAQEKRAAKLRGRKLSPEHCRAIGDGNRHPRGKYARNYFVNGEWRTKPRPPKTAEARHNIGLAARGRKQSKATVAKRVATVKARIAAGLIKPGGLSYPMNDRVWITNGQVSRRVDPKLPLPTGWLRGRAPFRN